RRLRLGTGDDQAVQTARPERVDRSVGAFHVAAAPVGSRNLGQCVEAQADVEVPRAGAQQRDELPFGGLQRGVGHVVDEGDVDAVRVRVPRLDRRRGIGTEDRKSTRLNSSHVAISYAVFCLKKKKNKKIPSHEHMTKLYQ